MFKCPSCGGGFAAGLMGGTVFVHWPGCELVASREKIEALEKRVTELEALVKGRRRAVMTMEKRRFWVGWTSTREGVATPFTKWTMHARRTGSTVLGQTYRYTFNAVIDAGDREAAWQSVVLRYPDASELFVREREANFWPPAGHGAPSAGSGASTEASDGASP
jgi:hypothetical protein